MRVSLQEGRLTFYPLNSIQVFYNYIKTYYEFVVFWLNVCYNINIR